MSTVLQAALVGALLLPHLVFLWLGAGELFLRRQLGQRMDWVPLIGYLCSLALGAILGLASLAVMP